MMGRGDVIVARYREVFLGLGYNSLTWDLLLIFGISLSLSPPHPIYPICKCVNSSLIVYNPF